MYFLTVSFTTVGYGDISPSTSMGQVFTMFWTLIGMIVVFPIIFNVGKWIIDNCEGQVPRQRRKGRSRFRA